MRNSRQSGDLLTQSVLLHIHLEPSEIVAMYDLNIEQAI